MGHEESKIKNLEDEKKGILSKINLAIILLGRELGSLQDAALEVELFSGLIDEISKAKKKSKEKLLLLEQITSLQKRHKEIEKTNKAAGSNIRAIMRENTKFYETIGGAAYSCFLRNQISGNELVKVFNPIRKKENELKVLENEIEESKDLSASNSFISKLSKAGKQVILQTSKAIKNNSFSAEFYKVGMEICNSGLIDTIEDEIVFPESEPWKENVSILKEIEQQINNLEQEDLNNIKKLKDKCGEKNPEKYVAELKKQLDQHKMKVSEKHKELGSLYLKNQINIGSNKAISDLLDSIAELDKQNLINDNNIKLLRISIKINGVNKIIKSKKGNILRIEKKIIDSKKAITDLKGEISIMKDDIITLENKKESINKDLTFP